MVTSWRAVRGSYDVVLGGGGIIGCASAFFLASRIPAERICVVERDPSYSRASTVLSVGSIRQQFSQPGNILMSLFSYEFLQQAGQHLFVSHSDPVDVQFVEGGYLFLASVKGDAILRENCDLQRKYGARTQLLDPTALKQRFPWLNTRGVSLGSLGVKHEGWFDPWLLLAAFKNKILSMGVHYVHAEVSGLHVQEERVTGVKLQGPSAGERSINCGHFVNAGGPQALRLALMAGVGDREAKHSELRVALPVRPRKRCVFVFKCPEGPVSDCPLVVDTSGVYFRPETTPGTFVCGRAPPQEEDGDADDDFEVDHALFEERIWPDLAERVPAFEALKVQSAWAGHYEYNTLDQNAIIGPHPLLKNFVFANGFSGHGIQQSPAVGRAVSEVIVDGRTHSIDLSAFSFERILRNRPLLERNVI